MEEELTGRSEGTAAVVPPVVFDSGAAEGVGGVGNGGGASLEHVKRWVLYPPVLLWVIGYLMGTFHPEFCLGNWVWLNTHTHPIFRVLGSYWVVVKTP